MPILGTRRPTDCCPWALRPISTSCGWMHRLPLNAHGLRSVGPRSDHCRLPNPPRPPPPRRDPAIVAPPPTRPAAAGPPAGCRRRRVARQLPHHRVAPEPDLPPSRSVRPCSHPPVDVVLDERRPPVEQLDPEVAEPGHGRHPPVPRRLARGEQVAVDPAGSPWRRRRTGSAPPPRPARGRSGRGRARRPTPSRSRRRTSRRGSRHPAARRPGSTSARPTRRTASSNATSTAGTNNRNQRPLDDMRRPPSDDTARRRREREGTKAHEGGWVARYCHSEPCCACPMRRHGPGAGPCHPSRSRTAPSDFVTPSCLRLRMSLPPAQAPGLTTAARSTRTSASPSRTAAPVQQRRRPHLAFHRPRILERLELAHELRPRRRHLGSGSARRPGSS